MNVAISMRFNHSGSVDVIVSQTIKPLAHKLLKLNPKMIYISISQIL